MAQINHYVQTGGSRVPEIAILHTADVHLDWPFSGFGLDTDRGRARREDLKQTFSAMCDLARQRKVQVVLFAGDLFEHRFITKATVQFVDDLFRSLAPARVFILPGRHDPLVETSYYSTHPWAPNVHIFGPQWERVDLDGWGVSVYGQGFGSAGAPEVQTSDLRVEDPERINIAMLYGAPQASDLARIGADYIALGGSHQPAVVLQQQGRVVAQHPGTPSPLTWDEKGRRGVVTGTVGKASNLLQFEGTDAREVIVKHLDVTGARTNDDITEMLLAAEPPLNRQRNMFQITLTGSTDPYLTLDLPLIADRLSAEYHWIRLCDRTIPDYEFERLGREKNARGHFVTRMLALQQKASGPAESEQVRRALIFGLRAFERGASR